MRNIVRGCRTVVIAMIATVVAGSVAMAQTSPAYLDASLNAGSLANTRFLVSYSYPVDQVLPVGDSFIILNSFDSHCLVLALHDVTPRRVVK